MGQSGLHPRLVALLRSQGWSDLTGAQKAAQGPLMRGKHLQVVVQTGHDKTESALLPALSRIHAEREPF